MVLHQVEGKLKVCQGEGSKKLDTLFFKFGRRNIGLKGDIDITTQLRVINTATVQDDRDRTKAFPDCLHQFVPDFFWQSHACMNLRANISTRL